ncbi:MAG TPA: very short patch repair endonuclease [Longimicrobium sp.]|jgi:DNA mismatch endonuclease (patch repair protein)|uniref:very short patch repair endonuclease n=1 Tax=Longimicrobium sp. TaxID=2029185 RepID=UPI002ED926E6
MKHEKNPVEVQPRKTTVYRPKSRDEIARNMAAIRSTENRIESALRSRVHKMGLRYRKYVKELPGKPDFIFPKERIAIFVDGDYWHGRIIIEEGLEALEARLQTPNKQYWLKKLAARVVRDRAVTLALEESGWVVLRFWESDVKKDIERAAGLIADQVRARRAPR